MPRKPSKKTYKKNWRKYNDLSGRKFGRLLVIERDSSKEHPRPYYRCLCDCGNEVVVCGTSLTRRRGFSRSCGCWNRDSKRLLEGEACRNALLRSYKNSARKRGLSFELTREEFFKITSKDCFYCGGEPSSTYRKHRGYGTHIYNGIDRVNNKVGYTLKNCVSCCSICNLMKRNLTLQDFLEHIENIYNEQVIWEEK